MLDVSADGYVRGEACRALYMVSADAKGVGADGRQLEGALVRATAVNTNGRASSLTAPHGPTQQELLRSALEAAGLVAADVDGLQLHSNGTSLGQCTSNANVCKLMQWLVLCNALSKLVMTAYAPLFMHAFAYQLLMSLGMSLYYVHAS